MSDFAEAAASLYPSMQLAAAPSPAPAAAPAAQATAPTPDAAVADRLYGNPAIKYDMALRALENGGLERLQTPTDAKAQAQAWGPMFSKFAIEPQEAEAVASVIVGMQAKAPTDETRLAWRETSREALRKEYGDDAGVVLGRLQTMVKADPKLRDALNSTGLGDHRDVVMTLAASAQRMFKAGKLPK